MTNYRLEDLLSDKKILETYFDNYPDSLSKYKEKYSPTNVDKYKNCEFAPSNEFVACRTHTLSISSHIGVCGDSRCTTILNIKTPETFWKYFDEYCNQHKEEIFDFIVKNGYNKELKYKVDEIDKQLQDLQALKNSIQ